MSFLVSKTEREDLTALIIHEVWDFPPSSHDSKSQSDPVFHNTKFTRAQDQANIEGSPQGKQTDLFARPPTKSLSTKG